MGEYSPTKTINESQSGSWRIFPPRTMMQTEPVWSIGMQIMHDQFAKTIIVQQCVLSLRSKPNAPN